MERGKYALLLANHWSFTGIGWQLGIESCRDSIEESLNLADTPPYLKVCINLDARAYEAVDKYYPETTERLRRYLKEGKTEIIGGSYGQPMGSMVGNESVIRQLIEGAKTIEDCLDYKMVSFLEEEEFTFPQLPQILNKTGFKYASLAQCDTWGKTGSPEMKYSRIKWVGKDGSSIPATPRTKLYFHPPVVTKDVDTLISDEGREKIKEVSKYNDYPVVTAWTEFGWEPPTEHNINQFYIENYQKLAENDDVEFLTLSEYLSNYSKEDDKEVFVAYDDFKKLLPWGVGADQIRKHDRKIEKGILFCERLDAVLTAYGEKSERELILSAWKDLLISQSHDVSLCEYSRWGGGVMPPEDRAEDYYNMQWGAIGYNHLDNAYKTIEKIKENLFAKVNKHIKKVDGGYKTFAVFNMTDREFNGNIVTGRINFSSIDKIRDFSIVDANNKPVAYDIIQSNKDSDGYYRFVKLSVECSKLQPMSISQITIVSGEKVEEKSLIEEYDDKYFLRNSSLTAEIDKNSGLLTSLICNETGESVLSGDNLVFNGQPSHDYPGWTKNVKLPYLNLGENSTVKINVELNGKTKAKIVSEFRHDQYKLHYIYELGAKSKSLSINCRLIVHVPPQAADGNINGWQLPLEITDGYWLDFKPSIENPEYIVDAPFEVVKTNKKEFHASTFLDIKGEKTSLMIVHGGNQYFKLSERGLSNLLLREWESHFTSRCDWQVYTEYSYSLFPHKTTNDNAVLINLSREKDEIPVICEINATQSSEKIVFNNSLIKIDGAILSSIRKVEDGIEIRVFNPSDDLTEVVLSSPFMCKKAFKTDMIGNILSEITIKDEKITDKITPWEIATYIVKL